MFSKPSVSASQDRGNHNMTLPTSGQQPPMWWPACAVEAMILSRKEKRTRLDGQSTPHIAGWDSTWVLGEAGGGGL